MNLKAIDIIKCYNFEKLDSSISHFNKVFNLIFHSNNNKFIKIAAYVPDITLSKTIHHSVFIPKSFQVRIC